MQKSSAHPIASMIRKFIEMMTLSAEERANRAHLERKLSALKCESEESDRKHKQAEGEFFSKWGRDRELPFFIAVPGPECTSPRDGKNILKSSDSMFLAAMLHRSRCSKIIIEALDQNGTWHYFPEVAGTAASLNARGMEIRAHLNRSTLRGYFKESFLLFRARVSSREATCHDFFIEKKSVREFESRGDSALWKFGSKLKRPFNVKEDPLIDQLHEVPFFDWIPAASTQLPPLKHGEVYCPLDGPVIPIKANERTPSLSWEISGGTEWKLYLCPKCLGCLESWLWRRS